MTLTERIPLKQGLKLNQEMRRKEGRVLTERIPLKQGLKLVFNALFLVASFLTERIPLKQGLKHHVNPYNEIQLRISQSEFH